MNGLQDIISMSDLGWYVAIFGLWLGLFQTGLPHLEAMMYKNKPEEERVLIHDTLSHILYVAAFISVFGMPLIIIIVILKVCFFISFEVGQLFTGIWEPIIKISFGLVLFLSSIAILVRVVKRYLSIPQKHFPKTENEKLLGRVNLLLNKLDEGEGCEK